ncbi:MAG: TonB-dependent receptor [Acidobacteriota bacterium]
MGSHLSNRRTLRSLLSSHGTFTWRGAARCLAITVLAMTLALPALGQTTGRIEGRAVLENGNPLGGVTVTATSDSLQGDREVVAGADGSFRFVGLPPGTYRVSAGYQGFATLEQGGVQVGLDRTVTLEFQMRPADFGDIITVSDVAPVVDVTTTTGGANFGEKLFKELPVTRTYQGLAFAAPGVTTGAGGQLGDDNPSIGGASVAENRYVVDGLDSTNPAFGTSGSAVPFEFIKEVQVKTGGYEAEHSGALGGVLNVITKSGGNELQGDVFGYYNDDSLQAEAKPINEFGQNLGFTEYDFGASVGGKLIEDKLWYFVALNPSTKETEYTTRTGTRNTESEDALFYAGKLTWQLNPSHQFVFSAFGDPREREDDLVRNSFGTVGDSRDLGAETLGLSYSGSLSGSLFSEASIGRFDQTFRQTPLTDQPFYEVRNFGRLGFAQQQGCAGDLSPIDANNFSTFVFNPGCVGGTFHQESGDSLRDEARGSLTWFGETLGVDHEIKVGASARRVEYTDHAHYPGAVDGPAADSTGFVYDPGGLAGQRWLLFNTTAILFEYDQDSEGETDEQSFYFQDRVRLSDYFSLNLGVRSDAFNSKGDLSDVNQSQELDFSHGDMIAPRVGFTWDVAKNGRSKLYGHYGQFYESVPLDINTRAFGNEQFNLYYFAYPTDGSLPNAQNPGTWTYTYQLGGGTRVDPGIEPMYTVEALVGFEYELMPNVAVGVKATQREIENVVEDISVDGGQTYFITNPGGVVTANPVTGVPLPAAVTFPEPVRDYEAYELTVNRRFADNWQLFGSYVHSKNEGNYGGLFRQDNGQLDPNITSVYDLPELLNGAFGPLPNDREHQVKLYGSYLWPFKLITGFYGQWLSGTPISQLGAHPVYGNSERFVTPRGSFGTTPDVWNLDLHVEYPITLSSGLDLKLVGDVFNVTDQQEATQVDEDWTFAPLTQTPTPPDCGGPGTGPNTSCPNGNPQFGQATQFQAPRTLRLGVKLSW